MHHQAYQRALNGLGVLPYQPSKLYSNPLPTPSDLPPLPAGSDQVLAFVRSAGFSDIVLTASGPTIVGTAKIVYRYSPRAVIEGELNPFMNYLNRDQVLNFWRYVYSILNPSLTINKLEDLNSDEIYVIPDPGGPNTKFFSLLNRRIYGPVPPMKKIPLCAPAAGQKYSDVNGPVQIVSPAGQNLYVMHSVKDADLDEIAKCGGLAWSSFAVKQGHHDWPALVTFYLDARILYNNLHYKTYAKNRQKAVHIAAWDNWTLRPGDYGRIGKAIEDGTTVGNKGLGFIAAEYLAVGLDTTMFEQLGQYKITDLEKVKGAVHPIHNWDQLDDAAKNMFLAETGQTDKIKSRFKGARYESYGVKSYVELKVIDFIPISDIPLCVVHDTNWGSINNYNPNTRNYTPEQVVKILRQMGFKGEILVVNYADKKDKKQTVDFVVNQYVTLKKKRIATFPSVTSGVVSNKKALVKLRGMKEVTLPSGLIISDIEVTRHLYNGITGESQATFIDNPNNPVVMVSWFDAVEFCNKFTDAVNSKYGLNLKKAYEMNGLTVTWNKSADGFRLPTEKEWQYAAMGGGIADPYGPIDEIAWYYNNSDEMTHDVGQKRPNDYGLYDMLGNVYEWTWTEDKYGRVIRGGGWDNVASVVRAGDSYSNPPDLRSGDLGFRVCRNGPNYTPIGD